MSATNGNGKHRQKAPPPVPIDTRKNLKCFMRGQFVLLPRIFLHVFDHNEMLVMTYLCDTADKFERLDKRYGWFPCSLDDMEWELSMNADTQQRTIKKLVGRDVLETKKKGWGRVRRWFRINDVELNSLTEAERLRRQGLSYKRKVKRILKQRERDDLRHEQEIYQQDLYR